MKDRFILCGAFRHATHVTGLYCSKNTEPMPSATA